MGRPKDSMNNFNSKQPEGSHFKGEQAFDQNPLSTTVFLTKKGKGLRVQGKSLTEEDGLLDLVGGGRKKS